MNAPYVVETQNGTTFVVKQNGKTQVVRPDQPEVELPTADIIEAAEYMKTTNAALTGAAQDK